MIGISAADELRSVVWAPIAVVCGLAALVVYAATGRALAAVLLGAVGVALIAYQTWGRSDRLVTPFVALGVAASCWDSVRLIETSLFDVICALGAVATLGGLILARSSRPRMPPPACWVGVALFGVATALVAVFPPDPFYLASRFQLKTVIIGAPDIGQGAGMSNLGGLARLVIGLLILPVIIGWFVRSREDLVMVARAFVAGASVSCLVAICDFMGVTQIAMALQGFVDVDNRFPGLTHHANHLGLSAVMALPFVWLVFRSALLRMALTAVLVTGVYVSGSRSALVGAMVPLVLWAVVRFRWRALLAVPPLLLVGAAMLPLVLEHTRLGKPEAAASDAEHFASRAQGLRDFAESPIFGIGLKFSQDAHVVLIQLLASAGLLGLIAYVALYGTVLTVAYRLMEHRVVAAAGIAVVTYLVVGLVSNALLVRYIFIPVAIVFVAQHYFSHDEEPGDIDIGGDRPLVGSLSA